MLESDQLETIQERLGLHFSNTELLEEAFTHSSYAYENATKSNERLEFLGDSVLQYYVSVDLYTRYEDFEDGDLTRTRSKIVDKRACALYMEELALFEFLQRGDSIQFGSVRNNEQSSQRLKANLFEAILGAIQQEFSTRDALDFCESRFQTLMEEQACQEQEREPRVELNEFAQRTRALLTFDYVREGPDHELIWEVTATLRDVSGSETVGTSRAATKAQGESDACREILRQIATHAPVTASSVDQRTTNGVRPPRSRAEQRRINAVVHLVSVVEDGRQEHDYISILKEFCDQSGQVIEYVEGHASPGFRCTAYRNGEVLGTGTGRNKKVAKKQAALQACQTLVGSLSQEGGD